MLDATSGRTRDVNEIAVPDKGSIYAYQLAILGTRVDSAGFCNLCRSELVGQFITRL